jgi:16S rRNA (cytosine967-C5)-methyltransferase
MRQASLIGHVIEVFALFLRNTARPADIVIRHFFHERKYLGSKDRKFIADSYFGIIKNYRRAEEIVRDVSNNAEPTPALIAAAYFITSSALTPEQMNEVLLELRIERPGEDQREVLRAMADSEREKASLAILPIPEQLAITHSFPTWFVERISAEYGGGEVESILQSLNAEAPIVLRTNTLLIKDRDALVEELQQEGFESTPSALAPDALLLPRRLNVMGTKAFKRGAFEIQDEASQMVAPLAVDGITKLKVLDACAGAGGKTLHIAALMQNRGEIFATDVDPYKLEELKKRVRRSTAQNVRIIMPNVRETELAKKHGWFDIVVLDVPCTGSGTLRRNPSIKWVLTESMLNELVQKQRDILEDALAYVRPGGILLYATCSILKEEGEDQLTWLESTHPGEFFLERSLRTRPDIEGCDGFYAAKLRKSELAK